MKRVAFIFAVIGLIFFCYVQGWGADWKYVGIYIYAEWYYDTESISHPSKNIARVWLKEVFSEKGVIDLVGRFGQHYKNVGHAKYLHEFDCVERKGCLLKAIYYSNQGETLDTIYFSNEKWNFIAPDSIEESLCKAVCK